MEPDYILRPDVDIPEYFEESNESENIDVLIFLGGTKISDHLT